MFRVKTENTGRIIQKLESHGYVSKLDDDGNITSLSFYGDKLSYDEGEMFKIVAPYVEDGSYIEMHGEDGAQWRWAFSGGDCQYITAKTVW